MSRKSIAAYIKLIIVYPQGFIASTLISLSTESAALFLCIAQLGGLAL
jgi:hypothetical protein